MLAIVLKKHTYENQMNICRIFFINFLFFTSYLISHGFGENTLICLDDNSLQPIATVCKNALRKSILIKSYDTNIKILNTSFVVNSGQSNIQAYIRFGFEKRFEFSNNHHEIICTPTQVFYLADSHRWCEARTLCIGDRLFCANNNVKEIAYIQFIEKSIPVYTIEVPNPHTFFVTNYLVLTHNVVLPTAFIGLSIPIGTATGGSIASIFGPLACTFGAALGTVIGVCATIIHSDSIPKYTIPNIPLNIVSANDNDAQAPGKPTEKDGYKPPKKWDGKKVKNPNGSGSGWPDHKGNVWVPTGNGPLAHGGPHWDVQNPKTGKHKNILPGGKER